MPLVYFTASFMLPYLFYVLSLLLGGNINGADFIVDWGILRSNLNILIALVGFGLPLYASKGGLHPGCILCRIGAHFILAVFLVLAVQDIIVYGDYSVVFFALLVGASSIFMLLAAHYRGEKRFKDFSSLMFFEFFLSMTSLFIYLYFQPDFSILVLLLSLSKLFAFVYFYLIFEAKSDLTSFAKDVSFGQYFFPYATSARYMVPALSSALLFGFARLYLSQEMNNDDLAIIIFVTDMFLVVNILIAFNTSLLLPIFSSIKVERKEKDVKQLSFRVLVFGFLISTLIFLLLSQFQSEFSYALFQSEAKLDHVTLFSIYLFFLLNYLIYFLSLLDQAKSDAKHSAFAMIFVSITPILIATNVTFSLSPVDFYTLQAGFTLIGVLYLLIKLKKLTYLQPLHIFLVMFLCLSLSFLFSESFLLTLFALLLLTPLAFNIFFKLNELMRN